MFSTTNTNISYRYQLSTTDKYFSENLILKSLDRDS